MSKYRRAARVDDNQSAIVDELRSRGYSVEVGHDDILVGRDGRTFWYEIKNPNRRSEIKESQVKLLNTWKGHYKIVKSAGEILLDIYSQA